jgi:hypothetical protein
LTRLFSHFIYQENLEAEIHPEPDRIELEGVEVNISNVHKEIDLINEELASLKFTHAIPCSKRVNVEKESEIEFNDLDVNDFNESDKSRILKELIINLGL